MTAKILPLTWFERETSVVAHDLIGCTLCVVDAHGDAQRCIITETEAYLGEQDAACHSFKGRKTERTSVMYAPAGTLYVYLIYGMYNLLNIVTKTQGEPEAVLIRAAYFASSTTKKEFKQLAGPGKLTRQLNIGRDVNGKMLGRNTGIWIEDKTDQPSVVQTPRIGIDYAGEAQHWLERYCWEGHPSLSQSK